MIRQGFALFDMDGTVTEGDSILPMIRYAIKTGFAKKKHLAPVVWGFIGYSFGWLDDTRAKEMALAFLKGKTVSEVKTFAEDFCRDILLKSVFPAAREEMTKHLNDGRRILLVTASPDFYLQPLIQELNLSGIIGTRADISPEGVYTGRISGRNCRGMEKTLRVAEYLAAAGFELDTEDSYAYGDSSHDWPMMTLAGHPVAVNAKKKLLAHCGDCTKVTWKF